MAEDSTTKGGGPYKPDGTETILTEFPRETMGATAASLGADAISTAYIPNGQETVISSLPAGAQPSLTAQSAADLGIAGFEATTKGGAFNTPPKLAGEVSSLTTPQGR